MVDALLGRVKRAVGDMIGGIAAKAVLVLFLLMAVIFLISALNNYLHLLWGPVAANLTIAAGFFGAAVVTAIVITARQPAVPSSARTQGNPAHQPLTRSPAEGAAGAEGADGFEGAFKALAARLAVSPRDAELALLLTKAAAPIVLPRVLKFAVRHLPAIGMAAAALYLVARHGPGADKKPAPEKV